MREAVLKILFIITIILIILYIFHCHIVPYIMPIITFLAVIVALFRKEIHNFILPPILKIHSPRTIEYVSEKMQDTVVFEKTGYYIIDIENIGSQSAKNVEVYFSGIDSNVIQNFNRYKIIPLVESWSNNTTIRHLHQNSRRRFTLCMLIDGIGAGTYFIKFACKPEIEKLKNINLRNGELFHCELKIEAYADNAKPAKREIILEYRGDHTKGLENIYRVR